MANSSGWERFRDYHYTPDLLNWTSVNDNGYVAPLGHNGLNQYTSINGFAPSYDGNFNQTTTYHGPIFVYDALNRVVGGSMQCTYDGLGRCLRRTIGGKTIVFAYDGWKPVTEYDGAGNLSARNIYGPGPDELLMRGSGFGWFFYHADKQGSVSALVDLGGNVVEKYSYDAFGRPTVTDRWGNPHYDTSSRHASWYGNRFMFTGREWFPELHVYDYRHRLYNPDNGRFLQKDPIGFDAGDMNLFRYCADDPVNKTDPMGLQVTASTWNYQQWLQGSSSLTASAFDLWRQRSSGYSMASMSSAKNGEVRSARSYSGASVKIEHDESFDLSQDPIYLDTGGRANAKTSVQLGKPVAVVREDGTIRYTQTLTSKTTFPVPNTEAIVKAEWRRVEAVREHRKFLQSVAEVRSLRSFANAAEAQKVIGGAVRRQHEVWMDAMRIKFDVFNSDGGTQ